MARKFVLEFDMSGAAFDDGLRGTETAADILLRIATLQVGNGDECGAILDGRGRAIGRFEIKEEVGHND